MLKQAVFAVQMAIPGKTSATRALHPDTPGKTRAFAYGATASYNKSVIPFIIPGDYLRLAFDQQTGVLYCYTIGKQSIDRNYTIVHEGSDFV